MISAPLRDSGRFRAAFRLVASLLTMFLTIFLTIIFTIGLSVPAMAGDGEILFINGFEGTGNVPQFVSVDDQAVAAEQRLQVDIDTSDPVNQAGLAFSLLDAPSGMTISAASGLIIWTPTIQQVGTEPVTVQVEDLAGLTNSLSFNIEVIDPSASPLIEPIADATVLAGDLFTLQVQASDPDPADVLDYSLDSAPAGLVIDMTGGLLEWMPASSDIGAYPVTVRATDPSGQFDVEGFELTVVADNRPPELIDIPDRGAAPGVVMELIADAIDPDGDPLTWSLTQRPPGMTVEAATGAIRWVPVLQQLGPHPVMVEVRDPSGFVDSAVFEVFVDFNRPPVAVDDSGYRVERGDTLSVPAPGVLANDTDPNDDPLTSQIVTGPQRGTLALNAGGGFDYTPDNPTGTIGFNAKWSFPESNGGNFWIPIIANLDDDPQAEILAAAGDGCCTRRMIALDGITGDADWEVTFLNRELSTGAEPAVADIDLDGMPELLVIGGEPDASPTAARQIYAFEHDGTLKWISDELPNIFYRDGVRSFNRLLENAALTVADLDGDGLPEILVAPDGGPSGYHVWDHEGRTLQTVHEPGTLIAGRAPTRVTVVDLDLDGDPEIVVGNAAWSHTGELLWKRVDDFRQVQNTSFPVVANLDDDPYPELVRTRNGFSGPGNIVAWNHDGTDLLTPAGTPWEVERTFDFNTAPISIADVDADGDAEVLVPNDTSTDRFDVLDGRDGSVKWSKTVPTRSSGATVFDMDRDGFHEVVFFDAESNLHVWDGRNGTERLVFDTDGEGATMPPSYTLPVFADIDTDGQAELVTSMGFTFGFTPLVSTWESPTGDWAPARAIWNEHRYHVTNVNDDLTIPVRERPHWLQPGLNQYMINARLPDERSEEQDTFTYFASDGELDSNEASVEITILPPNAPPRILSTPPTLASPGFEYVYNVLAVDADAGELLAFEIAEGPAGMSMDADGRVSWIPAMDDNGSHPVVISVSDALNVRAFQDFILEVRDPVHVPELIGLDEATAIAALEAASLRADPLRETFSDTVAVGDVALQNPSAGTFVAAGAGVAVEISRGPVPVSVPRLTGLKREDALAALFDAGLAAAPIDRVNDSEIPLGVIGQQDPPPNAQVPPGSDVAIVVSGGPRAVIQVDPPLIPAGGSATVSVEVRDVEGAPLDPQPDVTLALDTDPGEMFGTFPTLTGNTIDTGIDTQGDFAVEATFDTGSVETIVETIATTAAVLPAISDGPGGTVYTEFAQQLVEFNSLVSALIEAVDAGDGPAIEALDQALADLEAAIDIGRLRTMTAIAPEGGVPPSPAQALSGGLAPVNDDNAYAEIGLDLVALLETLDQVVREGTAPDLVINQLNQDLAAAVSALARLEPSAVGVLRATPEIIALLGTYAPRMLVADIKAVRQALRDAGVITAKGRALPLRFTLPGIMTASSIRQTIISDFYVPYLGQVARALGVVIAADLLQPYVNGGSIVGIVTGASQAIHVFEIPNSVIEGFGFDPKLSPNNAVTMVGPSLIDAVTNVVSGLPGASDFKDINSILDAAQTQIENADAVGTAWKEANSIPNGGVARGCILDGTPGCRQLIYSDGFASVYQAGGLSLPAPVLIITRNLESGNNAVFIANFVPTEEE